MLQNLIYTVEIMADQPGPATIMVGFRISTDREYRNVVDRIDTLFVSGGIDAVDVVVHNSEMLEGRQAFIRQLCVNPQNYRNRFSRLGQTQQTKFNRGALFTSVSPKVFGL